MPYDSEVGYFTKVALPSQQKRLRRKPAPAHLFVQGPIPVSLLAQCWLLHPAALHLLLRLKVEADTSGQPIKCGERLARSVGLRNSKTKARALAALERGGLITVERGSGRAPSVAFASELFKAPR